jgi:rare lipoprotein A
MNRALLLAGILPLFATGALAQGPCSQGVRIISAYYAEGRHTASGQRFDPHGLTAAHRTFPFGTRLLVVNPHNGKSVTVTVNDRGPFVRGVSLDLSLGAAKTIGMSGTGAVCMARVGEAR